MRRVNRKMISFECPLDLLEKVKRFAEEEEIIFRKVWLRAAEHCLTLPSEQWLRRKRKVKA